MESHEKHDTHKGDLMTIVNNLNNTTHASGLNDYNIIMGVFVWSLESWNSCLQLVK